MVVRDKNWLITGWMWRVKKRQKQQEALRCLVNSSVASESHSLLTLL